MPGCTPTARAGCLRSGRALWYADMVSRIPFVRRAARVVIAVALGACNEVASAPNQGPIRPSTIIFSVQPEYAQAGLPIGPGVAVTVMYNTGDTAYSATVSVRLRIQLGTGKPGAQLVGDTAMSTVNGTALFTVAIDSAGSGYRLLAVSDGLGAALSDSFTVTAVQPVRRWFTQPKRS